jgi:hypothetical protein
MMKCLAVQSKVKKVISLSWLFSLIFYWFFFFSDELVTILMDGSFIVGLQMLVVK